MYAFCLKNTTFYFSYFQITKFVLLLSQGEETPPVEFEQLCEEVKDFNLLCYWAQATLTTESIDHR